jgi:hypothetical protein
MYTSPERDMPVLGVGVAEGGETGLGQLFVEGGAEKDYAAIDARIKQDFAQSLDPNLMQFADLLVQRFEIKTEQLLAQATKRAERAEMKADEAITMARAASTLASNAETLAVKAVATSQQNADLVEEQGKKIVELEKLVRDVVKKGSWGTGNKPSFVKSKNNLQLSLSPEERLAKLQTRYMELVAEANTTNRFILGRKKGASPASQDQAKAIFESFFPGVKYFIIKPGNAEFFRVTVLDGGATPLPVSPTRRSQRISQRHAVQQAVEALSQAVDTESFELDEVAKRLRGRRKRAHGKREGVCIYACGDSVCSHQKMTGPSQNYTP